MNLLEMQNEVYSILSSLGARTFLVFVKPIRKTVAAAVGVKLNGTILGFEEPVGGFIYVDDKFLNKAFSDSEIRFVLAHECAHIIYNHVIASTFWKLIEQELKGENNENYEGIEFLKLLLALASKSHLPPNAETLRNQEYEADRVAVNITGDLFSAISCLTKLAGNDMKAPSHAWELFGKAVPAMTMGERLATLQAGMEMA